MNKSNFLVLPESKSEVGIPNLYAFPKKKVNGRLMPGKHQEEAISCAMRFMEMYSRFTIEMACGSGKTPTALWCAQLYKAQTILVLVPTLSLLKQTYDFWESQGREGWVGELRMLCVCSDKGIRDEEECEEDWTGLMQTYPTGTNGKVIADFLNAGQMNKKSPNTTVIFCTYASAKVVGEALEQLNEGVSAFDVGIFDEAHKTTGIAGKPYSYALSNSNIYIGSRIFFTATPKNVVLRSKAKVEEKVFSMDDESIYGPVAYKLSFKEAVDREIIVPYRVIISVIDDKYLTRKGIKEKKHSLVAFEVAMNEAMKKYGIQKTLVFHNKIEISKRFTAGYGSLTKNNKTECFHIDGKQPMNCRQEMMKSFAASERAILSNSRCLQEGIDMPEIGMIGFFGSRRSKIDVAQAVGRVVRMADGKLYGYVLLPIHLQRKKGETIEQALESADMTLVISVLRALFESDGDLKAFFKDFVKEEKETIGGNEIKEGREGDGSNEDGNKVDGNTEGIRGGRIVADFLTGSDISDEQKGRMLKSIKVELMRSVMQGDFYDFLKDYIEFKGEYKREPRQSKLTTRESRLYRWAWRCKTFLKKEDTKNEQVIALNNAGFDWTETRQANTSMQAVKKIAKFVMAYNEFPIKTGVRPNEINVYKSLDAYHTKYRNGTLREEVKEALLAIPGFKFRGKDWEMEKWMTFYWDYRAFVKEFNRIPIGSSKGDREALLAEWGMKQVEVKNKLTEKQINLLKAIKSFPWSTNYRSEHVWELKFSNCKMFFKKEKRKPSTYSDEKDEQSLANWISATFKKEKSEGGVWIERANRLKGEIAKLPERVYVNEKRYSVEKMNECLHKFIEFIKKNGRRPRRGQEYGEEGKIRRWADNTVTNHKKVGGWDGVVKEIRKAYTSIGITID